MKQHPISYHLTPYSRLDAKELARFALATTRKALYFTVKMIHFFGGFTCRLTFSPLYLPLSRVLTMLCPILISTFSLTILCITRGHRLIYAPSPFSLFLFFSRTKGYTRAALSTVP